MQVKRLVIGTAQIQAGYGLTVKSDLSISKFKAILEGAESHGIDWIDTAQSYGEAESWISRTKTEKYCIATKISIANQNTESLIKKVDSSRDMLGDKQIKIIFAHDWEKSSFLDKRSFISLRDSYPSIRFGASLYETSSIDEIISQEVKPSTLQIPLSVLNQSFLPLIEECKVAGIDVWGRSLFLQGAIDYLSPKNPFKEHPDIKKLQVFCSKHEVTPLEVAILFAQSTSLDKFVIGFENSNQLKEVAEILQASRNIDDFSGLSSSDLDLIDPRRWG